MATPTANKETRNVFKTTSDTTMIRRLLNLWHHFKALVLVAYALYVVFKEHYGMHKQQLLRLILFILGGTKEGLPIGDLRAAKASIKVARQKFLEVPIRSNSTSCQLFAVIGVVWFCEKIDINLKFNFIKLEEGVFGNSMWIHSEKYRHENPMQFMDTVIWENYAKVAIPSEYGHKIISRLKIKEALLQQVDEWVNSNLHGNWVGVHYRGTDHRSIETKFYIDHLKEVLDDQCSIFACSDQAQFIDQIKEAFPGRVFAREIIRSCDSMPLHRSAKYGGNQQQQNALIDILILSRTNLIYTTVSWFADVVRFFNPAIKIISLFKSQKKIDKLYSRTQSASSE